MPPTTDEPAARPDTRGTGLLVTAGRVAGAGRVHEPGWLAVAGERIADLGTGPPPRAYAEVPRLADPDGTLLPGFVDVHVHGALGHDTMDADPEGLAAVAGYLATRGVTGFCATTWAASHEATLAALDAVARAMRDPPAGARLLGAHLEGPYLSPARAGAQDAASIRPVDRAEATALLDTGVVRALTLAPELADADWLVGACRERGVVASAGHTDATYDEVVAAADAGLNHATHTFNAMRPLHHRDPGAVGAVLDHPGIRCEVIADGRHVHPAMLRLLLAAKGLAGVVLVSDAVRGAGVTGPWGRHDGPDAAAGPDRDRPPRAAGGRLAGSVLALDAGLRALCDAIGAGPAALWPAASGNAAAALGLATDTGSLAPGLRADLVLLDARDEVSATVVAGRVVHRTAR